MRNSRTNLSLQAIFVIGSSSEMSAPVTPNQDALGNWSYTQQVKSNVPSIADATRQESLIFGTSFSSVPVIWQIELSQEYQELGDALGKMTELEEADEWKIDPPVYEAASNVAAELMANAFPAPRIFTHGPKSVVFNWSQESSNLYLTISADKLSALISTPKEIKRRIDYSINDLLNPAFVLRSLQSTSSHQPVVLITGSVSSPSKLVD